MPVTCPKCGRETGRQEKFCENCGAFLGWEEGESADSQVFPQQAPQQGGDQRASVRVQIKDDLIEVAPGNAESTTFTVKNLGTQVEQFRSVVTGPDWLAIEPPTMTVYPGDEATGTIQAAPPRKPGSAAGVTPFRLTVTSALHAHVSSSASGRVDVAPYHELAAELVPTSSTGRGLTRHHITLDNRGNTPLRITLNPTDVADGLRLGVPAAADVPPGTVTEVPVSVYGTRRWIGRPEPKTFAIIAEPPKPLAPARLPGTRTVIPVFPRWVPVAAAALLAAAIAATTLIPKLTAHNKASPSPAASSARTPSSAASSPQTSPSNPRSPTSQPPTSQPPTSQPPTSQPPTSQPPPPQPPPPVPPVDLIAAARNAVWTSFSPHGPLTTQVQNNTGCQLNAVTSASQGAVFTLQQVALEDGTVASKALEIDPPGRPSASISGVYTLPKPTVAGDVFRAEVGFCQGVAAGTQMQYQIVVGSQPPPPVQTVDASTGQLAPVAIALPTGTTQITLRVMYPNGGQGGDVVWVDPRVEAGTASPPPSRPPA